MTYKKIYKILLLLLVLLQINFFNLITFPDWFLNGLNSYSVKLLSFIFIMFGLIIKIIQSVLVKNISKNKMFFLYTVTALITIWCIIFFGTIHSYNQSFKTTFYESYYVLLIIAYYVFHEFFMNLKNINWFFKLNIYASALVSIISIVQSVMIAKLNINLFSFLSSGDKNNAIKGFSEVSGFIRLASQADFVFFASSLILITFFAKNIVIQNRIKILVVNILYLFLVAQVRTYLLILLVLMLIMMLILLSIKNKKFIPFIIIMGAAAIAYVVVKMVSYLGFFGSGSRSMSYVVRLQEIDYFVSHYFDNGYFGIGFSADDLLTHGFSSLYGKGIYYIDDIGLIGSIAIYGVLGIIWICVLLFELIKVNLKAVNKKVVFLLTVILLITSGTLIYLNPQRFYFLIFSLLIIDFFAQHNDVKRSNNDIN